MDKAAFKDQIIFWNFSVYCKNPYFIEIPIYLLVAIMKKKLKIEQSLYTILHILSISLFEKIHFSWAFTDEGYKNKIAIEHIQLNLFDS